MIIHLPLMAIPSMIANSSLNDQWGYSPFYTSISVDGQLQSMNVVKALNCLSSRPASHIFAAMQSGMSVHDSIVLKVMCLPGIFSSPFVFMFMPG